MEVDESEEDKMTVLRNDMVQHLLRNEDIVFKSQQRGEPDLTATEKRDILEKCLSNNPTNFLARFSRYMLESHFDYVRRSFPEYSYEVGHYLKENSAYRSETTVKNRRLEALKRLAVGGDYFTEAEMKKRNPLLYEQLVGKHLTEEERHEKTSFSSAINKEEGGCKLSSLLLEQYERDLASDLQKQQEESEELVESDSDSNDAAPFSVTMTTNHHREKDDRVLKLWGESDIPANYIDPSGGRIAEGEKKLLFEEFRSHMYSNFIEGKESDFDYSKVDTNTEYDDLDELDRDAQDKYFTTESPEDETMEVADDDLLVLSSSNSTDISHKDPAASSQDPDVLLKETLVPSQETNSSLKEAATSPVIKGTSLPVRTVSPQHDMLSSPNKNDRMQEETASEESECDSDEDPLDRYMSRIQDLTNHQDLNSKMKHTAI